MIYFTHIPFLGGLIKIIGTGFACPQCPQASGRGEDKEREGFCKHCHPLALSTGVLFSKQTRAWCCRTSGFSLLHLRSCAGKNKHWDEFFCRGSVTAWLWRGQGITEHPEEATKGWEGCSTSPERLTGLGLGKRGSRVTLLQLSSTWRSRQGRGKGII